VRRPVPGWAVAFLRAGRAARLGTADTAGQPLVVPVCYVFDGKRCYVPIDAKPKRDPSRPLKRLRNIEENPRVSLVVDGREVLWTSGPGSLDPSPRLWDLSGWRGKTAVLVLVDYLSTAGSILIVENVRFSD